MGKSGFEQNVQSFVGFFKRILKSLNQDINGVGDFRILNGLTNQVKGL